MAISPLDLPCLADPHDLQGITAPDQQRSPIAPHLYSAPATKSKAFY